MGRRGIILFALALSLGCARHHDAPPKVPADYTAPRWHVSVNMGDAAGLDVASANEMQVEYERVTRLWLDYWKLKSGGWYRPSAIPFGDQSAAIEYTRECSNSAEEGGKGAYGAVIHVWSCTHKKQRGKKHTLKAACHRLSHVISGAGSGGNASHNLFREVCGC